MSRVGAPAPAPRSGSLASARGDGMVTMPRVRAGRDPSCVPRDAEGPGHAELRNGRSSRSRRSPSSLLSGCVATASNVAEPDAETSVPTDSGSLDPELRRAARGGARRGVRDIRNAWSHRRCVDPRRGRVGLRRGASPRSAPASRSAATTSRRSAASPRRSSPTVMLQVIGEPEFECRSRRHARPWCPASSPRRRTSRCGCC